MARSDDDYDLVHTYDQGKAGKSKTARPAVRELGREGAATELLLMEEAGEPRTPPSGVRFLFFSQGGDLKQKNPDGTVEDLQSGSGAPDGAEYVTTALDGTLTNEKLHSGLSGADLHPPDTHGSTHQDGGADQLQVDTLAGDNGSAGQVLETDGSSLGFSSPDSSVPDWTEDPNSPFSASSDPTLGGSLALSEDVYLLLFDQVIGRSNPSAPLRLTVNGKTSPDYNYTDLTGTKVTAANSWNILESSFAQQRTLSGEVYLTPGVGGTSRPGFRSDLGAFTGPSAAHVGDSANRDDFINSFNLEYDSGEITGTVAVYGITL